MVIARPEPPHGNAEFRELLTHAGPVGVLVDPGDGHRDSPTLGPSIGEYPVYDSELYASMTDDDARNLRFRRVLAEVCPGRSVLDVGTGADLNWALEAVRCGARRVDAVEVIEQSYLAAQRRLATLPDRDVICLHLGSSTELALPEPAEVCVGEVIGSVAGAEGAAAVMRDVRARLLVPGGVIVPHRAVTRAAGATLGAVLGGRPVAFAASWLPYLAAIFTEIGGPRDVRLRIRNPAPDALVTDSAEVEILDFNGDLRTEQEQHTVLTVDRPGLIDGVLAWLQLWPGPDGPPLDALATQTNWASVYFPLFEEEIPVVPGDRLELRFRTELSDDGIHPDYAVSAALHAGGRTHTGSHISRHHGTEFRADAAHRRLFPAQ